MEFKEIDFYLESITESYRNTKLVKKGIHSNLVYHIRQNSSQKYYEYRTDKIGKSKSFLRCSIGKCSARLSVLVESNVKWPKKTFFYLNGLDGGECRKMYPRLVFGVVGGTA